MATAPLRSRQAGFTMVELLTVLLILGLVAALAAPSFREFTARSQLRGAANEAYTDLQYARAEAVQRNARVRVTFAAGGYTVALDADNSVLKTVALPGGTTVSSGDTMVALFDPVRATATVTNGPAVLSSTGVSGTIRLAVNALGRAEICSPSGSITGVAACTS